MKTPESGSFGDHENVELIDLEQVVQEIIARNELISRYDPFGWEFYRYIKNHYERKAGALPYGITSVDSSNSNLRIKRSDIANLEKQWEQLVRSP